MNSCSFLLLGTMQILVDSEMVAAFPGGKVKLLLAYLLLAAGVPQNRRKIAFDFWPDSTEKRALSNLRKLLHDLRKGFPQVDSYIETTPAYILWHQKSSYYTDVEQFVKASRGNTLSDLRTAEELYLGELLPGFYEEWIQNKREALAITYTRVLEKLIAIYEYRRDYSAALYYANKLLIQDRLREEAYRTLMRLHALNRNTAGIAHVYHQLCNMMEIDLGVEPCEDTLQLFNHLMDQRKEVPADQPNVISPITTRASRI